MTIPGIRTLNLVGFLSCAGLMAYALYAEHVLYLMPCPLCVFQRLAVISLGIIFLLVAMHNPAGKGRYAYATLLLLAAGAGVSVAGWHIWIQNLPADEVPSCGPGFNYIMDTFNFGEALRMIFTGSGECASIDWSFLGLTMPTWVVISVSIIAVAGLWNNVRKIS
ncbi:MAG: disulfide bond formation protein B [Woeseia sp.]|jgi:protein dithiol:quinone oxidoreductase|nr:disulfide bond formation protein B [Woeseia sp.]